jgi:conjugal transfer pilus assembly protein TraE
MDFKVYQSQLSQLSARFNLMVCLVFGLLISNMLLSFFIYFAFRHHTVEITPFSGSPGYLKSASFVDTHYLSLMTENFINERLNVSPETVDANHKRLLSFVNHQHYSNFLKVLTQEAKVIKTQKMSSTYDITQIKTNPNDLTARVYGRLKRYVGTQNISDLQRVYELSFKYIDGRLSIVQFALKKEKEDA